jgi:hypothetical protein
MPDEYHRPSRIPQPRAEHAKTKLISRKDRKERQEILFFA